MLMCPLNTDKNYSTLSRSHRHLLRTLLRNKTISSLCLTRSEPTETNSLLYARPLYAHQYYAQANIKAANQPECPYCLISIYTVYCKDNMSLVMRKPVFRMCENKGADQLRGNREADQHLCFRNIDSTIPLLPICEIQSL